MKRLFLLLVLLMTAASGASAQMDDMCREFGVMPSFDSPFAQIPYVYGRVAVKGLEPGAIFPSVTVMLVDSQQTRRITIGRSGNYCFRKSSSGGTLVVEVNGVESGRRSLAIGGAQQREDFEVNAAPRTVLPSAISARFSHPSNTKTIELYRKAADAEKTRDLKSAITHLNEIVVIDSADFIAWAKLGSLYFSEGSLTEADAAFRKSLALRSDYTAAWLNVGKLRMAQKQPEAAVEIFKHASSLDPTSARTFQLLGEAYLQAKQGTLGAAALNEALRLDPVGAAEAHLVLARLYDLAGAKKLATKEYKAFLGKVPDHPDKKKFEKYIEENPE